jgi:glycosyltransferase involved in cell wall biosynthesis
MRVLYLDLNYPDLIEDYSRSPNKYGGGRIVASHLMPYLNDNGHYMEIWADEKCFENVEKQYKKFCKPKSYAERLSYVQNETIKDFDIVLHNFPREYVKTTGKSAVWLVGHGEWVNPKNEHVILYNDYQSPHFTNPNMKLHYARIGVPIPEFKEYPKENFIFSCHRQTKEFGSETMMKLAHKYNFKYICAGPRDSSFPNIMDYVDNITVLYFGLINENTKIDYFKRAMASTYLHSWQTPFNLSACQSLAYGTPCIAATCGFWPSLIKHGINGFLVNNEEKFVQAIQNCRDISQRQCYDSITKYTELLMIQDYIQVFKNILK